VSEVSKKAEVPLINATKVRHGVCTTYACLDMFENDRKVFLEHMGHESSINKDVYQCPIGLKEVRVMGQLLSDIDKGRTILCLILDIIDLCIWSSSQEAFIQ